MGGAVGGESEAVGGLGPGVGDRGGGEGAPSAIGPALCALLPPLHRRVRGAVVNELVARVERLGGELAASASLPRVLHEVLQQLRAESAALEAGLRALTQQYAAAIDGRGRRAVLEGYLRRTVTEPRELAQDLAALDRWLTPDALRERIERRRAKLGVHEETALRCLAGRLRASEESGLSAVDAAALASSLLLLAMRSPRTQTQQAALEALIALGDRLTGVLPSLPQAAEVLISVVEQRDAHPFVQAEALRALGRADERHARALLERRLGPPWPSERDFLFRRQVVETVIPELPADRRSELLTRLVASDPSEWVRIGICERLRGSPWELELLERLGGSGEQSPKVRAAAVLASAQLASEAQAAPRCWGVLIARIASDGDPVVQRLASEKAAERIATLPPQLAEKLKWALGSLRLRDGVAGPALEAATIALQALRRVSDRARLRWTEHLAKVAAQLPVGGRCTLDLAAPLGLPRLPEDPDFLGAILAELSTSDHGLYASRDGTELTLWRGDRFRRRAWRVLHELRRPAPNKRQGFSHTIGRALDGELRAHPWRLDELTETTVPGERVHVASQGCWGRHLPLVDDLLDLPRGGELRLYSGHGVTLVTGPRERLRVRWRLTRDYQRWAKLRLGSLEAVEPRDRARYVQAAAQELGVQITFRPYQAGEAVPAALATLFPPVGGEEPGRLHAALPLLLPAAAVLPTTWVERLLDGDQYLLSSGGNGMVGLALFTAALFTWFLVRAYRGREGIRAAREQVPLSVGGWGTRGKSGTERLKAALFGGLGFEVFAKTTGSEAMFVHSAPGAAPSEFFIFRPYDKATIWEQRDMVELGQRLGTEVFLWECMALQPNFVELLQNDWMRDDWATLTNAYPDHEDIQGPAGQNVAEVISRFIPSGGRVVTSEDNYLPLFEEQARQRGARLVHAPWYEAELIPQELLALFPYREHPRNVALVATLAEQLGVTGSQAVALMAEHVQPEIGVLKVFPEAKVRGRALTFINGHSANERTGFLNNWRRTGLGEVEPERHPDRAVLTVINNRWDRVARSEVFARILVEDAPADRHVLIGTNLDGLQKYVRTALEAYLARTELVRGEDLRTPEGRVGAASRLAQLMARVKVPRPSAEHFLDRVGSFAQGAELALELTPALVAAVAKALDGTAPRQVGPARSGLGAVRQLLERALIEGGAPAHPQLAETLGRAGREEVVEHALFLLARMAVHASLGAELARAHDAEAFNAQVREAYRELFLETLVPVPDAHASGDQIVERCARSAPPGATVSIIGAQNIKGTGLDWVYRWIALDRIETGLRGLRSDRAELRLAAYESLASFEDHGFVDAGVLAASLPELIAQAATQEEAERLRVLQLRAAQVHRTRVEGLGRSAGITTSRGRIVHRLEQWFDYLDSIRRRRLSDQLIEDLVHQRVSHPRAALETRKLYERQKGGWLGAMFSRKRTGELPADPALLTVPGQIATPKAGEGPLFDDRAGIERGEDARD